MRGGTLLLIIGLLMAYLGVSGKYKCFTKFFYCVTGVDDCNCGQTTAGGALPRIPALPRLNVFG